MSDEASLLSAVYAAPGDDAPRAAYARWLIAEGSALGHFIDAQLRGDEAAAAAHHAAAVVASPIPLLGSPRLGAFERGFLTSCLTSGALALPTAGHGAWALVANLRLAEPQAAAFIEAAGARLASLRTFVTDRGEAVEALARVRPRPLAELRVPLLESWFDLSPLLDEHTVLQLGVRGVCEVGRDPGRVHLSPSAFPFQPGVMEQVLRAVVRPSDEVSFVFMGDRAPVDEARRVLETIPHGAFSEHGLMVVG